jgi:glycosyltransferase involved in cell wall biosynthesis
MITAVIPAYNEERYIADVVERVLKYVDVVIVVDNNSEDGTARLAEGVGALVLKEHTRGAGSATNMGLQSAKAIGSDIVVTIDGDGQHDPADIPHLIEPILKNDADVVLGSRFMNQNITIPLYRKFGIKVITLCCNICTNNWITDAQCGLRAFSKYALQTFDIEEHGYGIMIEEIMKAKKAYLRVEEVPVQCFYRGLKSDSGMNPIKQGIMTLLYIIKWRLRLVV